MKKAIPKDTLFSEQRDAFICGYRDAVSGAAKAKGIEIYDRGPYSHGQCLGRIHVAQAEQFATAFAEASVHEGERRAAEIDGWREAEKTKALEQEKWIAVRVPVPQKKKRGS